MSEDKVRVLAFCITYFLGLFGNWWCEYRKPMKCLETLDFHCDNCRCWTCPRFHMRERSGSHHTGA
jgi:hypothetical protein